jgi:hypothetical protein
MSWYASTSSEIVSLSMFVGFVSLLLVLHISLHGDIHACAIVLYHGPKHGQVPCLIIMVRDSVYLQYVTSNVMAWEAGCVVR